MKTILALVVLSGAAWAQSGTASLAGEVVDPAGRGGELGVLPCRSASRSTRCSEESQNNFQAPAASFNPNVDRGPSNFDTRHNVSASVSYEIPHPASGLGRQLLGGFAVDGLVRSRSALPVNLLTNKDPFGISVNGIAA